MKAEGSSRAYRVTIDSQSIDQSIRLKRHFEALAISGCAASLYESPHRMSRHRQTPRESKLQSVTQWIWPRIAWPRSVSRNVHIRTTMVHNGVMATKEKTIRQSITLPAKVATQVRSMAKRRRLSANRMLIELLEDGLEAQKQKEKAFYELAERFRAADDPKEAERLGEELGQMVFGR